jgi:hypothetical protein
MAGRLLLRSAEAAVIADGAGVLVAAGPFRYRVPAGCCHIPGSAARDQPRPPWRCYGCAPARKVAAARGIVIAFDAPDNRLPDAGLLTDLGQGKTSLAAGFRQSLADGHRCAPSTVARPLLRLPDLAVGLPAVTPGSLASLADEDRAFTDTRCLTDAHRWEILIGRVLAFPPPYRAAAGSCVYVIQAGDRAVLVASRTSSARCRTW